MEPRSLYFGRRRFLTAAAGLISSRILLRAQDGQTAQPQPSQQPQPPTFTAGVQVVTVYATVRTKKSDIVRDLNQDDFTIEEDGKPQTIRYFSRETDLPLTLGLLVDTSGSQRRVLGEERSASTRFFDQVLREDKDRAFLIHFDREVELLQDLTSSRKRLETALAQREPTDQDQGGYRGGGGGGAGGPYGGGGRYPGGSNRRGGGTALYDAVLLASDELMRKQMGRKAEILLTDGVDRGSKTSLTEAIASAQRADTLVYSILFADREEFNGFGPEFGGRGMGRRGGYGRFPQENRPDGKKILQRISEETGGGFFEVSSKQPVEKIYDHIEEELRTQYSLGYTPEKTGSGPGFRAIHVTVKKPGLIVQARNGYYAKS